MRISDWSSDVCSSDLPALARGAWVLCDRFVDSSRAYQGGGGGITDADIMALHAFGSEGLLPDRSFLLTLSAEAAARRLARRDTAGTVRMGSKRGDYQMRAEEHRSEHQSLMRKSYAVCCLT